MHSELTNQIVNHILGNLGVTLNSHFAITHDAFLLNEKIAFDSESDDFSVWGTETKIQNSKFRILYSDISGEKEKNSEHVLITKLENVPLYGCYLLIDHHSGTCHDGLVAFSNDKSWVPCSTYLQATFLAGMEQLNDVNSNWTKIQKIDLIKELKSFIDFSGNMISQHTIYGNE